MSAFTRILLIFAAISLGAFGIFSAQQGATGRALGSLGAMLLLGCVAAVGWFSHRFTAPNQKRQRNVWKYFRALEEAHPNHPLWVVKYLWIALIVILLLLKVYKAW